MKREDISKALSGIEDKYIEEAAEGPSIGRKPLVSLVKKWLPAAACIVLAAGIGLSMLGGPTKSDGTAPEALGESSAPTADPEGTSGEVSSVIVKLLDPEGDELRAVITGLPDSKIFPVGTEVLLDLSETVLTGGEQPDQSLTPDNLWMIPAEGGEEVKINFDSWMQEGGRITLHVERLFILN